jgi:hypothetical protein
MNLIRSNKRVAIADCFAGLCSAAICAAVVVLCARAPTTTEAALSRDRELPVARDIARAERVLRLQAVREFPGDQWSQGDAYSFREFRRVIAAAAQEKAAIGSVLNALDEYLRKNPNKNNQNRVPLCKPRSFYD